MEAYASVLLIAIPFFLLLMLIEAIYSWATGKAVFRSMDTISSLSSGMTNTLKSVLGLTVVIIAYSVLVEKIALIHIETTWVVYVLAFLAIDFASYWGHRLSHSLNLFWNKHVIHHSSEEFNLAVALRQPISDIVSLSFIFLLPAALLGLPAEVIGFLAPIHLFMQFWYHTKFIPKLGLLEYILVTPSQHRVHHAINDIYLDKNLSAIFCIWDRIFGTFQEELDEVPPVYGVKRQIRTWNPIKHNFVFIFQLAQDAWHAQNWWDKIRLWFMPTGWRPDDVKSRFPISPTAPNGDVYAIEKYDTQASKALHIWSWAQYFIINLVMMIHMLIQFTEIGFPNLFFYAGFLFISVYSYTTLMDRDKDALWMEAIRSLIGLGIIFYTGDWFTLNSLIPGGSLIVAAYLMLSVVVVGWFVKGELAEEKWLNRRRQNLRQSG